MLYAGKTHVFFTVHKLSCEVTVKFVNATTIHTPLHIARRTNWTRQHP